MMGPGTLPRRILAGWVTLLCVGMNACSRKPEAVPVYPVRGEVTFEGRTCAGAVVILHAVKATGENKILPRGRVDADGTFRLSTYGNEDGAPAGEYAVVVEWKKVSDHPEQGVDLLPARYGAPTTTPLKVTVKEEPTELKAFRLTR